MDYEKLLKKAVEELPESIVEKQRFEIPKVKGHIQGNRTVLSNFKQIAKTFNRDVDHFLKFILKELATPGKFSGDLLILGRKVSSALINEKIKKYANIFVLCPVCGKPDTLIETDKGTLLLRCTACGAKHPIRKI
ncbi:translation initiation factor IF-2 subunit beta [Candidatus Woesearchaeota archaeon]|nr:translation initiation factor IF-2 subunit beta [Candidatus Woesearchaeota archaeon]